MRTDIQLLTEDEVAQILAISIHTCRLWRKQGKIPFIKVNQTVRYHPVDVAKFLSASRQPAITSPE